MKMDPEMPFQIRTANKAINIDRKSLSHALDHRGNNFPKLMTLKQFSLKATSLTQLREKGLNQGIKLKAF